MVAVRSGYRADHDVRDVLGWICRWHKGSLTGATSTAACRGYAGAGAGLDLFLLCLGVLEERGCKR